MQHILIIAFSDLNTDPRVFRQIDYLRKYYKITTIGTHSPELDDVEFYPISQVTRSSFGKLFRALEYKLHRFEKIYWSLYDYQPLIPILSKRHFDLIYANDIETLPFALKIAESAPNQPKVLWDAHEYTPRHFEEQFIWRFFFQPYNQYLCKTYLQQCHQFITVTQPIAREYKKNYGIDPVVITNATEYTEASPVPVEKDKIRLISHGIALPHRQWESMIHLAQYLDSRFQLDLILVPLDKNYYKKLEAMVSTSSKVRLIPPVSREQIVPKTNAYDLSLLIFKPNSLNLRYALGNKFFESLQARLGIVTGPFPQPQAEIVNQYQCGIVLSSFQPQQMANELNRLTAQQIMEYKEKANIAARELTAEKNMEQLLNVIQKTIPLNP